MFRLNQSRKIAMRRDHLRYEFDCFSGNNVTFDNVTSMDVLFPSLVFVVFESNMEPDLYHGFLGFFAVL